MGTVCEDIDWPFKGIICTLDTLLPPESLEVAELTHCIVGTADTTLTGTAL